MAELKFWKVWKISFSRQKKSFTKPKLLNQKFLSSMKQFWKKFILSWNLKSFLRSFKKAFLLWNYLWSFLSFFQLNKLEIVLKAQNVLQNHQIEKELKPTKAFKAFDLLLTFKLKIQKQKKLWSWDIIELKFFLSNKSFWSFKELQLKFKFRIQRRKAWWMMILELNFIISSLKSFSPLIPTFVFTCHDFSQKTFSRLSGQNVPTSNDSPHHIH